MFINTKARVLVGDTPAEESCANSRVVCQTSLKIVFKDFSLFLELFFAVVYCFNIQLCDVNLETKSSKLFDSLVHGFTASCISISSPMMRLHANAIDLDVFCLHTFDHRNNLVLFVFADNIVIIVESKDR